MQQPAGRSQRLLKIMLQARLRAASSPSARRPGPGRSVRAACSWSGINLIDSGISLGFSRLSARRRSYTRSYRLTYTADLHLVCQVLANLESSVRDRSPNLSNGTSLTEPRLRFHRSNCIEGVAKYNVTLSGALLTSVGTVASCKSQRRFNVVLSVNSRTRYLC